MVLEMELSVEASIIIIQKPFINSREISHMRFSFYQLQSRRNEKYDSTDGNTG